MIDYLGSHPTAANLLMLLLVVLGFITLPNLQRETFPDFTSQEIEIRVIYPGAAPADTEESICLRLEEATDGVSALEEFRCEAKEGMAIAVARMEPTGHFDRFLGDIKTEVEAIDSFPAEVEAPILRQLGQLDRVVSVAITGPMATRDLKAYAEVLKDKLQQFPTISQVEVQGFSQHELRVSLELRTLLQHKISVEEVANAIRRQSVDLPAGKVETHQRDILIRFNDKRTQVRALKDLVVVAGDSGAELRLGDIATIEDRFELEEVKTLFQGQRAAVLQIAKTKTQDTLTVVNEVRNFVTAQRKLAPQGVEFRLTQDRASVVRDRLQMLGRNGLQGLALVFLVLWLFFPLRFAFWVTMGLPVSFLGGLFFMNLLGFSINMITMVALLIALGLLMDDAIVIAENIANHYRKGKIALRAAIEGTREVAPGVLSSFLTSVSVFGPLAFIEGDIGKVLKFIPMVLILVLSVSLVEAFFILPRHLSHALAGSSSQKPTGRFRSTVERVFVFLKEKVVGRLADLAVQNRYLFVGLVLGLFLVSVSMLAGGHLKFRAFPDIDGDVIEARILMPQGTPLWRMEQTVQQVTTALQAVDQALSPLQTNGQSLVEAISVRYSQNPDAFETGPQVATVAVDLLAAEKRQGHLEQILSLWREKVGRPTDVLSIHFKDPQIGPGGRAIEIRLQGNQLTDLSAASLELRKELATYRGVVDLADDLRPGKPELRLRLRDGALALGLDAQNIASQLRAGFLGIKAMEFQVGIENYEVTVQLAQASQNSLEDVEAFRVLTNTGEAVPLRTVASLQWARGYNRIHRINGLRTVTVTGDVDTRIANAQEIVKTITQHFLPELLKRYPDIQFDLEGEQQESIKTSQSMVRGFALGMLGIFILLSFQFRSYIEPLVVMLAIPLAMIGVIWGHLLLGLEFSMPSMMGFVSLAGIVVNDSILLIEFLKLRVREGANVIKAATQASRDRFRAVMLTSLTTIAGLVPLLSEKSLQAQILIPLATSIVFGLLATTLLVLFMVPALFGILDDIGMLTISEKKSQPGK